MSKPSPPRLCANKSHKTNATQRNHNLRHPHLARSTGSMEPRRQLGLQSDDVCRERRDRGNSSRALRAGAETRLRKLVRSLDGVHLQPLALALDKTAQSREF